MLKDHREGHGVVGLPLFAGCPFVSTPIPHHIVIAVVRDLSARSDPALLIQPVGSGGEHERLHAKIELTVWLFTVDYVEAISDPRLVAGDLEIEPLVMMRGVDIRI